MKNNRFIYIFSFIIALSALFFFISKRETSLNQVEKTQPLEIDSSFLIKPRKNITNATYRLYQLDSAIIGKKLSISTRIKVYDYKTFVYQEVIKDFAKAHMYADSALALIADKDLKIYKNEYAMAYLCKGDVYYKQHEYNAAFPYYYKAQQIGVDYFDDCIKSNYSYRLAMIYYNQGFYIDAKNNFIKATQESQNCPSNLENYIRKQEILSNIGLSYYQFKKLDSASYYFNRAEQYILSESIKYPKRQNTHQEALGVVYGNLGDVYLEKNNYPLAKSMFKKSIDINLISGFNIKHAQFSYLNLSKIYLAENKIDSAYSALIDIKKSLDTINTQKAKADWNKLMSIYYEKKNNIVQAHNYLKQYQQNNDQWIKNRASITKVDLKKQFELFEKQNKVESLQKQNEVKKLYLIISAIFLTIALTLLIFKWINWKKSKNSNIKLNKLNKTILTQNKELETTFRNLSESSLEKERLLNLVAHDLRAPVASLTLLVDLIIDEKDEVEKAELMSLMKTTCSNALEIINETLSKKGETKKQNIKTTVNFNEFMIECTSLLEILAAEKQIEIDNKLPKEEISVAINNVNFKRVLNNIVINAIKFSPQGTKINITTEKLNKHLFISIQDFGIGIAPNQIDKIFELGNEYKRPGTQGEESYGIGLPFCKQVINEHNGTILIESVVGKGSTFHIKLPLE